MFVGNQPLVVIHVKKNMCKQFFPTENSNFREIVLLPSKRNLQPNGSKFMVSFTYRDYTLNPLKMLYVYFLPCSCLLMIQWYNMLKEKLTVVLQYNYILNFFYIFAHLSSLHTNKKVVREKSDGPKKALSVHI